MVSKLNAVFRHIIGSDTQQPPSRARKRSSNSLEDVSPDILETPQAKRARTTTSSASSSNDLSALRSPSTPIIKVASWIRQKASSFGETYFFRPVGNLVERGYPSSRVAEPAPRVGRNHRLTQGMSNALEQESLDIQPRRIKPSSHVSFKQPGEPPHRKQLSTNPDESKMKSSGVVGNGRHPDRVGAERPLRGTSNTAPGAERGGMDRLGRGAIGLEQKNQSANISRNSFANLSNSSAASLHRSKHDSYVPVRDKLFPDPKRRVVISQANKSRLNVTHNKLAVNECVRLKERQQYQQLIQQYTMGVGSVASGVKTGGDAAAKPEESLTQRQQGARPKTNTSSNVSKTGLNSQAFRTSQHTLGERVLPHQFTTKSEVREAVRQRLHAPASHLSPTTPSGERHIPSTPAQPNFNESESPIITSICPAPKATPTTSAFQQSLCATPYLSDDWVKDLKARFESSVRVKNREIDEHKAKLSLYEERRAKEQADIQQQIKARISKSEKTQGVIEDVIYHPEEKEEDEDAIEIVDDEDEEEDDDEGEDDGMDEEEDELPELTEEMDLEIDNALHPNPSGQGLATAFRLTITRRDMQTLAGLNWLNDEVMNFYFEMIMDRSKQEGFPNVHVFNTFFYPKLLNSGYSSIRRWTKKTDVFAKDLLLVPVHLGMHWCLAVIDFRHKTIIFYDSMGSHNQHCLNALRDYVVSEHADKKKQDYSMDSWSYYSERDIPQQLNGSDCGMFACKYAEYISRDAVITFTQHDMPYFRRRMVWEILHTTLL